MSATAFTPAQLEAIDTARSHLDTCVVAGPGSGKTTVLVEYFRRLVEGGVDPLRILAITFTEKAAGNMRKKLAESFVGQAETRARLERAWVSTVHGFCARLLRENAVFAGIDPEFQVLDAMASRRMQQRAMRETIDALFEERREAMRALVRGLAASDFERDALAAYDTMRGAGVGVEQLAGFPAPPGATLDDINDSLIAIRNQDFSAWSAAQKEHLESALEGAERILGAGSPLATLRAIAAFTCNLTKCKRGSPAVERLKQMRDVEIKEAEYAALTALYAPERELLMEILRRFDRLYREEKLHAGALDFSDLEEFTVRLLEDHPDSRLRLQRQFDHILMDEVQDTNPQQARLMELIRPADRFYAVGDINQSIFGFRHAEPAGFAEYRDSVQARGRRLVHLVDNFRSRAEILRAVETVTSGAPGIENRTLVAGRAFASEPGYAVEAIAAPDLAAEARWVASRILEFTEFGFHQIAVLVRNTEVTGEFTAAFAAAGIPYLVSQGRGFHENREVNDLTHLLRTIANPRDEISLATVLRSPLVGVTAEAILRLKMGGAMLGAALGRTTAASFGADDHARLERFHRRLRQWRLRREQGSFDRLLAEAIDDSGYPLTGNVDKFLAQARDAAGRMTLDEYVAELELVREMNPREPDAPPEDAAGAVRIMTVHSAKGLEFPVVFVAGMHKGVNTSVPGVAFSRHHGLGARWRNPADTESNAAKDDLFQHALRGEWARREEEESSRLLYVAMTRAEQHLVLSFSIGGRKPANWDKLVSERLKLDVQTPRDEIVTYHAPDGRPWKARIRVVAGAPELAARPAVAAGQSAVAEVALPTPSGQHDGNVNVTALALFASCPRKYYLARYLGYEGRMRHAGEAGAGAVPERSAAALGTEVHELLAGLPVANPAPEARRLAEVFRQSPLGRRAERATRSGRELDFLMAIEDLVVRGQIDLWFEEGGELVVADYKTDNVTAAEAPLRARDYALQLRLYALALERVAGRAPERAWLHFLRPDTMVEVDLAPTLLESPGQIVRDFQMAQSELEFPLVEGGHCARCPFYADLCPAGR